MVRSSTQTPTNGVDLLTQYRVTSSPAVFEQIMRSYGGMVFSVCVKVTKDPADAEDASQAVFLTLAVQCKTGAVIRYLGPWLKKVAKRTSLDLVRSRKRRTRREQVTAANRPEHDETHPSAKSEHGELSTIIRGELDQLPSKYRLPLVLHYFGGLSHEEISLEMKCTPAALGVRLHRARKMLGKRLTDRGVSLAGTALSAALVASVGTCISDRFIRQTSTAMVAMGSGVA
ncbi:MAG TPA: sigma-70 family RNA polymerase sigma factor, partial [Tepidisphaeraceae bacterium]